MAGEVDDVAVIGQKGCRTVRCRTEIGDGVDAVSGAVDETVRAAAATQGVIAGAANDRIRAAATIERVVAATARDGIVAAAGNEVFTQIATGQISVTIVRNLLAGIDVAEEALFDAVQLADKNVRVALRYRGRI